MTDRTDELPGGKWAQPNGPSELDCPWCTRNCFPFHDADDADCTCVKWCGTPDCTCEAPDPDTAALIVAFDAVQTERDRLAARVAVLEAMLCSCGCLPNQGGDGCGAPGCDCIGECPNDNAEGV